MLDKKSILHPSVRPPTCFILTGSRLMRLFLAIAMSGVLVIALMLFLTPGGSDAALADPADFPPVEPGPVVAASRGEVWPKPVRISKQPEYFVLRPGSFQIKIIGKACDVLEQAVIRYDRIIRREAAVGRRGRRQDGRRGRARSDRPWREDINFLGYLPNLAVDITVACESMPYPRMDESYQLTVGSTPRGEPDALLRARTVWGALRGMETFVQLLAPIGDGASLSLNATEIEDRPRFPHRGLLLDTSRHFLPIQDLRTEIDAMEAVKMNVFHWHIVDDQSFPWQSTKFPELSEKGAYVQSQIYSPEDVQNVIEYARVRGIRVVVEFDTPGHTRSWGSGRPGLLAACHDRFGKLTGAFANIDPTNPDNLDFLKELFKEIVGVFPDSMLHLGGDEVGRECWDSDPNILAYMDNRNMTGNFRKLQSEYLRWLVREVQFLNRTPIVWQEAWENGDYNPQDVIVQVWLGNAMETIRRVTLQGFRALLSESWYLDHLDADWERMYRIDPTAFNGSEMQRSLVDGGEACMWGEKVDPTNVHSRVWPRAAAVAERLWSPKSTVELRDAQRRIEELHCRLKRRGIAAQPPNGPGFCLT